ncbi:unnamed protein product [Callosobruchus maculatus]|uniref:Uncharacterized protein n=1 Tax=Callosobruchus maculatus TaxID=64391 RepID=A0A653DUE4_CALMS|nr:unnamed protein product [Callosobruchus maculatus]
MKNNLQKQKNQDIVFPTDEENEAFSSNEDSASNEDLGALSGTPEYGKQIEKIISTGNTKLAVALPWH